MMESTLTKIPAAPTPAKARPKIRTVECLVSFCHPVQGSRYRPTFYGGRDATQQAPDLKDADCEEEGPLPVEDSESLAVQKEQGAGEFEWLARDLQ